LALSLYVYDILAEKLPQSILEHEDLKKAFSYSVVKSNKIPHHKADYFVVPTLFLLDEFNRLENSTQSMQEFCESLPYWFGNESQHIFFDQSDFCVRPYPMDKATIFTVTPDKDIPGHYALPFYPYAQDHLDKLRLLSKDISLAKFDIFFKGCDSSMPIRKDMLANVPQFEKQGLACFVQTYSKYFWNRQLSEEEKRSERQHYFERLTDSKFVLCPRGTGTTSSRFFETMHFGRIPILISDAARLPLENKIKWEDLIIRVKEDEMHMIYWKIREFEATHDLSKTSQEIINVSHTYFVRDAMLKLVEETLSK
jgi:hypothetical protein